MKAKILELFSSIQGEGMYAGVKQVFVRFFECNIHCDWCDTPASIGDTSRNYQEMDVDELWSKIDELSTNCHSVSLTGGEPLIQKDVIAQLLPRIRKTHMKSYLETNGLLPEALKDVVEDVDIVAMDLKLPSSTKCKPYWTEHAEFLKLAFKKDTFIKTVVTADTSQEDVEQAVGMVAGIAPSIIFIWQPNTYELKNGVMKKCLEFHDYSLQYLANARIMPQMHKQLKVR